MKIYMSILDKLPEVKAVVGWLIDKVPAEYAQDPRAMTWTQFMEKGKDISD